MKKILLLSGIHICHNPRVVKEADALAEAGHEVTVLGMPSLARLREEDAETAKDKKWKFIEVPGPASPGMAGRRIYRGVAKKIADSLARAFSWQTEAQLGGWRRDLLRVALRNPADLVVAHSAATLWVAWALHQKGQPVAADFEDWFSRTHEKSPQFPDVVIERLEKKILGIAKHVSCPSEAMAERIGQRFGRKPAVIYNSFPAQSAAALASSPGPDGPKVLWISQALGPGRGLETLLRALELCEPTFTVTLVGNPQGNYQDLLKRMIPPRWTRRLEFRGQVKDREVMDLVSAHQVGLALEPAHPENKDLTCSNKIFQYLACGLAVIATKTKGQTEIAEKTGEGVSLVANGSSSELAGALQALVSDPQKLQRARSNSWETARMKLGWGLEKIRLLRLFAASLAVEPNHAKT